MLRGEASVESLMEHAATLDGFEPAPATLGEVELLKVFCEASVSGRTATLPPGLHPTNPPTAILHVWAVGRSPWGPFSMAEARIGCRSGTRPRGFVVGCVVDGPDEVVEALRAQWGFPARRGGVRLQRWYDGVSAEVTVDGTAACTIEAVDPVPLDPGDVAWTTTMVLAHTPRGPRLVQIEAEHAAERAERLQASLRRFDAPAWAHPDLDPSLVVSASVSLGPVTFPPFRFVARPDELAFTATEPVP